MHLYGLYVTLYVCRCLYVCISVYAYMYIYIYICMCVCVCVINSEILTTYIHIRYIYLNCRTEKKKQKTFLSEGNINLYMKLYNMYL